MIFGNEEQFAVEVQEKSSPTMARARIWIGGLSIGTLAEDTYMPSLANQLNNLINTPIPTKEEAGKLDSEGMEYILSEDCINNGRYLVSLGDTFDDFVLARYKSDEEITFLIQFAENPVFDYDTHQSGERYRHKIAVESVSLAIAKFSSYLED